MKTKLSWNRIHIVSTTCMLAILLLLPACLKKDYTSVEFTASNMVIADYFKGDTSSNTGLFLKILQKIGYDKLLGTYGTFTVFEPTNEAINQFITASGKTSIDDFSTDYLVKLVKGHIVNSAFNSFQFKSGALDDSTLLGNYLVISFSTSGFNDTYVNKTSKLLQKDIVCSNGIVHKVDHVIQPVLDNIYDYLKNHSEYSILAKAVSETGFDSLLSIGTHRDASKNLIKVSYTMFAETDSVMKVAGITSYNDLKLKYCNTGNPKSKTDSLNLFVGYHILTIGRIYANDFTSKNYTTAGYDLLISILTDDGVVEMNPDSVGNQIESVWDQASQSYIDKQVVKYSYVYFLASRTNNDATNGIIHGIDKIMPPKKPVAQTYLLPMFDTWVKPYLDSIAKNASPARTTIFQNAAGTPVKIFGRDSVLSYFKGRMTWSINYLGSVSPQSSPKDPIQSDYREICYDNQTPALNGAEFLGSIVVDPLGDNNGNCFYVNNYNEFEPTWITDYIVPGRYNLGIGYKNGNRYTVRVILDDDVSLIPEAASYINPSYPNTQGYIAATGQTYIRELGSIHLKTATNYFCECQVGTVTFLDKRKHKVKITNMTKYGAPGGNSAQVVLMDYIRFEAVK
jgi:uncharacterized surface protein with fasciclin (FAS1) repeats